MAEPSLFDRLKQRKLVQWALAYLAGAWAVLEAAGYVGDQFGWPVVVGQTLTVVAAFGFLILLVLAWYHGEKGRQRLSGPELLILTALLVVAGFAISRLRPPDGLIPPQSVPLTTTLAVADDRPSVAVLPFGNLSSAEEDAYLSGGIHEEVISQLAKIGGLKVVSRTSVMGYQDPNQNVREIAAELGVSTVLEGTVQKVLNRVRVTALLVDALTDEDLWSGSFDREITLENLLDIQAEVALQIAGALQTELTVEEQALVGAGHTGNLVAYQAYLRGRYFQYLPHYTQEDVVRASLEFQRAVELDSTFALAWMELANAHAQQVYYWTDASQERREMARDAAEHALKLHSPAPEVRLALGLYHLWLDRDGGRALEEIVQAEDGLPNDPGVYEAKAAVFELQGRFEDAIAESRKALNLSPGDASVLTHLAWNFHTLRQYDAAETFGQQAINRAPDQMWPSLTKVLAIWSGRGPTEESERLLEGLPHNQGWIIWGRFWQRMLEDRYEEALGALSDPDFEWVRVKMWARPKPLLEAFAHWCMGQTDEALRSFDEARELLEAQVAAHPDDPRYRSSLALAYAGLGRTEEAILEGERAVALLPVSEDAYYGLPFLWDLTAVHAMAGNAEEALDGIEYLLSVPSWVSPVWLEHDFRFDSLRGEARFQVFLTSSP
jgi:TolB-like protein/Flp pilus assembly protein TadD